MRISPFTPIMFHKDGQCQKCGYEYVMSCSDNMLIEVFHARGETPPALGLHDLEGNELSALGWGTVAINGSEAVSVYDIRGLDSGWYRVSLGAMISGPVHVTDDSSILDGTVLVQCAQRDNRSRSDIFSWLSGNCYYFGFRIPGGFKDDGWTFRVDNEQFVTPMSDIVELNAMDITEKTLTIGHSCGVPVWIADKINMMLSCDLVFIDGIRYSRVGDSVPEVMDKDVTGDRFVYSVKLQESCFTNVAYENKIRYNLRRTPGSLRKTGSGFRKYMA